MVVYWSSSRKRTQKKNKPKTYAKYQLFLQPSVNPNLVLLRLQTRNMWWIMIICIYSIYNIGNLFSSLTIHHQHQAPATTQDKAQSGSVLSVLLSNYSLIGTQRPLYIACSFRHPRISGAMLQRLDWLLDADGGDSISDPQHQPWQACRKTVMKLYIMTYIQSTWLQLQSKLLCTAVASSELWVHIVYQCFGTLLKGIVFCTSPIVTRVRNMSAYECDAWTRMQSYSSQMLKALHMDMQQNLSQACINQKSAQTLVCMNWTGWIGWIF